jgi:EmrB/QacA subfamily drug resistance transporter
MTPTGQRWVLALASLGSLMVALDQLVVATALSTIERDLGASIEALEWTVNAYSLSFAVLLMTAAALGDRWGRRRLFALGFGLFALSSAACALAPDIGWLIAARAVQGAAAAFVMPLGMALLSAAFPPERRARALGIFSGITGLAVLGGPVVGGAVTEGLAWQWIFWINIPIGAVAIPLIYSKLSESFGKATAIDLRGVVLVTGAALGLVWGLVRGNSAGWSSFEVVGSLVGGAVLGIGFVAWQRRAPEPMLPLRLFRSRALSAGNASGFFLYGSLYSMVFFIAQFLQVSLHYGPLGAGLRVLPWTATLFIVAPIAGSLVNRLGERPLIATGLTLQAIGFAWIALIAEPGMSYPAMIPALVICGFGVSIAMPAAQHAAVSHVTPMEMGKASGTFNMLRQLGGATGIAILVAVFAAYGSYTSFVDGFAPAAGVAAALSLAGAAAGLAVPTRSTTPATASDNVEKVGTP